MMNDLNNYIQSGEIIKWQSKPNKKAYLGKNIINPLLFFSIIWCLFDIPMMILSIGELGITILLFFVVHMTPVWVYLFGVFKTVKSYDNIQYILTDKALYVSGGIKFRYQREELKWLKQGQIIHSLFEQKNNVASIVIYDVCDQISVLKKANGKDCLVLHCLSDYQQLYQMLSLNSSGNETIHPNDYNPIDFAKENTSENATIFTKAINEQTVIAVEETVSEIDEKITRNPKETKKMFLSKFMHGDDNDSDYTNWDK